MVGKREVSASRMVANGGKPQVELEQIPTILREAGIEMDEGRGGTIRFANDLSKNMGR